MVYLLKQQVKILYMNKEDGYHVFDFERNQWWKGNKFGYTENLKEAGKFDYEEAIEIVKNSNINVIESEMVHSKDLGRLVSISNEKSGVKEKPSIDSVIKKYTQNNQYFKTNPVGELIQDLFNAGHFFDDIDIPHVSYEKNERVNLNPERGNIGISISLYRMPSGSYEMTLNKTNPNISHENDLISRKRKNKFK